MKREMKQKWIDALRSGKYEQGSAVLKHQDGEVLRHCCLGVLCELNPGLGQWQDRGLDGELYFEPVSDPSLACGSALPEPVKDDLRFDSFMQIPTSGVREVYAARGEEIPNEVADYLRCRDGESGMYVKFGGASLPELNDNGTTFAVIADIIERFVPVED